MEKFELQTEFECLVVTDKEQTYLTPANILYLEEETFAVYPATRKILPFVVNHSQKVGSNFRFFEKEGKTFCFLISACDFSKRIVEKIKVGKDDAEVFISNHSLELNTKTNSFSFEFEERAKKYKVSTFQNFIIVHLFFSVAEEIVLLCPSTGLCKKFFGKNFELQNNTLTFKEEKKDFAKSVIDKKVILDQNDIKEENTFFEREAFSLKKETICFCFLDCIKNHNFHLAKELLASSLQNVKEEDLKQYFQKPFKFFTLSTTEFALVYPEETKHISFKLENDKIVDFEGL